MFNFRIKKLLLIGLVSLGLFFGLAKTSLAGFGISPPYLKNQQLTPGSKYVQQIMLLRSSAEEELKAEINVNAPEIASWITLDKGTEFILPKDQVQVPMTVTVQVPKNAEIGSYKGSINIRITSTKGQQTGVAIALGARVDIDLTLTNVANSDFVVQIAQIRNFEMLKWPWNLPIFSYFLHRVPVVMTIRNIGNVKVAPSKVTLEVMDISRTNQLEKSENTSIDSIDPFSTKEVTAYFRTKLTQGQYWGRIKVYRDNVIVNAYEIAFTVASPGELGGNKLGLYPWLLLAGYSLCLILILTLLIYFRTWRLVGKSLWLILLVLYQPIRPLIKKTGDTSSSLKENFWRWIGDKASQYNNPSDKNKRRK